MAHPPSGMLNKEPCTLHGTPECLKCASPDEYFRWRVQNDPTIGIGWGVPNEETLPQSPPGGQDGST